MNHPKLARNTTSNPHEVCHVPVFELDDTEQLFTLRTGGTFLELLNSLQENGQLHPIKAMHADGPFTILDGFRRTRAARCLGWSTVCVEIYPSMPIHAARQVALSSNLAAHRETEHVVPLVRQALAQGFSSEDVLEVLGKPEGTLETILDDA